jgi:hypothetical protein
MNMSEVPDPRLDALEKDRPFQICNATRSASVDASSTWLSSKPAIVINGEALVVAAEQAPIAITDDYWDRGVGLGAEHAEASRRGDVVRHREFCNMNVSS